MIGWRAICIATAAILVWSGLPVAAAGLAGTLQAGACSAGEKSIVLYISDNALARSVLRTQDAFEAEAALIGPRPRGGDARPRYCEDNVHDPSELTAQELSELMVSWPVVVQVGSDLAGRAVRVFAHTPELSDWAGRPFVEVGALTWGTVEMSSPEETLSSLFSTAADFSTAIAAFHAGDLDTAIASRPAPASLPGLPRAWLTGIPLSRATNDQLWVQEDDTFDTPPSRGGLRPLELLRDVADGVVPPAAALLLSVPANDVECSFAETEDLTEIRWAGFVSGFWHLVDDPPDTLRRNDPLSDILTALGSSRSCFAAPIVGMATQGEALMGADDLTARLGFVIEATMADTPAAASDRRELAHRMVAIYAGLAVLHEDTAEREESFLTDPRGSPWRGRCTGPDTLRSEPVDVLALSVDDRPGSPVSLLLAVVQSGLQGAVTGDIVNRIATDPHRWLATRQEAAQILARKLEPLDAVLVASLKRHLRPTDGSPATETAAFLVDADDAAFDAALPELRARHFGFERQSNLARAFLSLALSDDGNAVESGIFRFRFADPTYQRAYDRLGAVIPRLTDSNELDALYATSFENAVRVAEIDILNLYFSLSYETLGQAFDSLETGRLELDLDSLMLPGAERNPWLAIAPGKGKMPDKPMLTGTGNNDSAVATVALSALLHALIEDNGSDWITVDADRYLAPLAILVDVFYHAIVKTGEPTATATDYIPSIGATRMFEAMSLGAERYLADPEAGLFDAFDDEIAARIAMARFLWNNGVGAFLIAELASTQSDEANSTRIRDVELGTRLLLAFFFPDDVDERVVATDIDRRLRAGADWPPAVQRLLARLAIDLVADDTIDTNANRAALLAEFDAILPVASRQRLVDAGYLQAAVAGLPFRLALAARDHGGIENLPAEVALAALGEEVSRFDFARTVREGPWRDLAGVLVEMHQGLHETSETADKPHALIVFLRDPVVSGFIESALADGEEVILSDEARAFASYNLLDEASGPDRMDTFDAAIALCPELAPTFLTWRLHAAGPDEEAIALPGDLPAETALLQRLYKSGDRFRTVVLSVNVQLMGSSFRVAMDPGLPIQLSYAPVGGLSFAITGQRSGGSWNTTAQTSVVATEYPASPTFAAALKMAEVAARSGSAEALAPRLISLETAAFGGLPGGTGPGSANATEEVSEQAPLVAPHVTEMELPMRFGVVMPPRYTLTDRIGYLPDAEARLIRLAARAEELELPAISWRIAGIAVALAMDRSLPAETETDLASDALDTGESGIGTEFAEEMARIARADAARSELREALEPVTGIGGMLVARLISAAIIDVPEPFTKWALCSDSVAGEPVPDDCILPAFTRAPAEVFDADAPTLCEALAQQVWGGISPDNPPDMDNPCAQGLLALDLQGLAAVQQPTPDFIRGHAAMGVVHLPAIRDRYLLLNQVRGAAATVPVSARPVYFASATRLANARRDFQLAERFVTLRLLAEIANPGRDAVSDEVMAASAEVLSQNPSPNVQRIIEAALSQPTPFSDEFRDEAQTLIDKILALE